MDELDKQIINVLQRGFPVREAPYLQVAEQLGLTETQLIERIGAMLDGGFLTRFGPMYHAEMMGGAATLAAVQAPEEKFDEIAGIINAFPEVAHNYRRDHKFNMWFVIATEMPEGIHRAIDEITEKTGLTVFNMPKLQEYFIGLKFEA